MTSPRSCSPASGAGPIVVNFDTSRMPTSFGSRPNGYAFGASSGRPANSPMIAANQPVRAGLNLIDNAANEVNRNRETDALGTGVLLQEPRC